MWRFSYVIRDSISFISWKITKFYSRITVKNSQELCIIHCACLRHDADKFFPHRTYKISTECRKLSLFCDVQNSLVWDKTQNIWLRLRSWTNFLEVFLYSNIDVRTALCPSQFVYFFAVYQKMELTMSYRRDQLFRIFIVAWYWYATCVAWYFEVSHGSRCESWLQWCCCERVQNFVDLCSECTWSRH